MFEFSSLQVLLVENEPDMRDLLTAMLEGEGIRVRVTTTAYDALNLLETFQPDVLISNVDLPDVDGYEFTKAAKEITSKKGGKLPAIAISSQGRYFDIHKAYNVGFDTAINEIITPERLISAIQKAIEHATNF